MVIFIAVISTKSTSNVEAALICLYLGYIWAISFSKCICKGLKWLYRHQFHALAFVTQKHRICGSFEVVTSSARSSWRPLGGVVAFTSIHHLNVLLFCHLHEYTDTKRTVSKVNRPGGYKDNRSCIHLLFIIF